MKKIKCIIVKWFMYIINKVFGVRNNKIIFQSFGGKSFSDNPKAIYNFLVKEENNLDIIWIFKEPNKKKELLSSRVKIVKPNTIKYFFHLSTAKFWIDNFNKVTCLYKSKKQIYIQTGHGDRGIKKIYYDSNFVSESQIYFEESSCDYIVTGSSFAEKMYSSAYRYKGEFLKFGCPRSDALFNPDEKNMNEIKNKLNIKSDDKILLFAPTLRRENSDKKSKQSIGDIDLLSVVSKINSITGTKWICLLRAHSAVGDLSGFPVDNQFINVSNYEDMADILLVTDLLITDYSSSATEFILTDKPVILYQSDYNQYLEKDRTLYVDLKKTDFLIAYDNNELLEKIDIALNEDSSKRNEKIRSFYQVYEDGNASKRISEFIFNTISNQK